MYALSRPYPWDSQMSSAAVNRTSTGNSTLNGSPRRSAAARRAPRAGRRAAAPYSISTKRTRRGVQKTWSERPV